MTSVGGKIMPDNAELVKNGAKPTTINTRHIIIDTQAENITESVYYALMWERDFYLHLRNLYPLRQEFYNLRMMSIENRINYVFKILSSHLRISYVSSINKIILCKASQNELGRFLFVFFPK